MLAKMQRKRNPCTLLIGMQIGAVPMENSMMAPQKVKNGITIDLAVPLLGIYPKELKAGF